MDTWVRVHNSTRDPATYEATPSAYLEGLDQMKSALKTEPAKKLPHHVARLVNRTRDKNSFPAR